MGILRRLKDLDRSVFPELAEHYAPRRPLRVGDHVRVGPAVKALDLSSATGTIIRPGHMINFRKSWVVELDASSDYSRMLHPRGRATIVDRVLLLDGPSESEHITMVTIDP